MAGSYPISPITWRPLPLRRAPNNAILNPGERALVESAIGATLLLAPPVAADASTFQVTDLDGQAGTNNITIDGNGALIDNGETIATTDVLATDDIEATYVWDDGIWRRALFPRLFDDDAPLQPHFRRSDVLAGLQPPEGAADTEFWVDSVNGLDTNPGTQADPFQTLEHAYSRMPGTLSGKARIHLVGAGPYTQPDFLCAPIPNGPDGQPLMVLGDGFTWLFTGTVMSVSVANLVVTGGGLTVNAFRGKIYHGLTGASAGFYHLIANNDAASLNSDTNTFNAAPGDTFEILEPVTVITGGAISRILGPGKIGFYALDLQMPTGVLITESASVLLDFVEMNFGGAGRLNVFRNARCSCGKPGTFSDFQMITDVGTQLGQSGAFFSSCAVTGLTVSTLAYFDGFFVSSFGSQISDSAFMRTLGVDIDMTALVGAVQGLLVDRSSTLLVNSGWAREVGNANAGTSGILASNGAYAVVVAAMALTNNGLAAVRVANMSNVGLQGIVSGSAGNGAGVILADGGHITKLATPTVTGTLGDLLFEGGATAVTWAQVAGSFPNPQRPAATKTASYVAVRADSIVPVDMVTAGASVVITLPASATLPEGWSLTVFDVSGGTTALKTLTVSRAGADTIDGAATVLKILPYASVTVQKSGTGRFKITASLN